HWLPKPDIISLLEQEAEPLALGETQNQTVSSRQDITEEIPNNILVEKFLWDSLWYSKNEGPEGHWERSCESLDNHAVQEAFMPVKTPIWEQQQESELRSSNSTNDS
ncbi:hypothetical protein MC885_003511, partial [Smutsia gigantea]